MAQWLALVAEYDKAGGAGGGRVSGGGGCERGLGVVGVVGKWYFMYFLTISKPFLNPIS